MSLSRVRKSEPENLTPLAKVRARRGISLLDLAAAIDYDKGNLSRIERGKIRPRPDTAIRLVEFFEGELTFEEVVLAKFNTGAKKPARGVKLQEAI